MIKEELNKQLFDKIPQNATIAIFGACSIGGNILKDLILKRKDVKTICFIDNRKQGEFLDLPIYGLKEFLDKNFNVDLVIVASISAQYIVNNFLGIYDIKYLPISNFILGYYEGNYTFLNDNNLDKVIKIFIDDEDKILYENLFKIRQNFLPQEIIAKYNDEKYFKNLKVRTSIKNQYLDYINKEKIKTIIDLGYHCGANEVAFCKLLPNYEHIYAFEPQYEICRNAYYENFLKNEKITLIKKAVCDKIGQIEFFISTSASHGSSSIFFNDKFKKIIVDAVTLNDFCNENNVYPDFIKMDIEGAELLALKGGIETIKKTRPQLAISIYHTESDFVNIPIYLYENLENYVYKLGHYSPILSETVLYAIPKELL